MDYDHEETFFNLSAWLSTLGVATTVSEESLSSGVSIAEALSRIDPAYFTSEWLSGIHDVQESDPWQLKATNLRKIHKQISSYIDDVLDMPFLQEDQININDIAQNVSKLEMCRMLTLLVNMAVNCPRSQEFIQNMMVLEESVQRSVMQAIKKAQDVDHSHSSGASSSTEQRSNTPATSSAEMSKLRAECEELHKRCFALDNQIALLQEEKQILTMENKSLLTRVSTNSSQKGTDDETGSSSRDSPNMRRVNDLSTKLERCQNELYKAETANEDLHLKLETAVRERDELVRKMESLQTVEDDYRKLKDECDELRSRSVDSKKLEATVEAYRRKIEEQSDLKAQVKILEDKNDNYMRSVIEVEEEKRKNAALRTHLEAYKHQVTEMDAKLSEEVRRADKAAFDAKTANDKLQMANEERTRVVTERDYYKEYSEELKASKEEMIDSMPISPRDESIMSNMNGASPDLRERLKRLETENEMLRASTSQVAQLDMLRDQLDVANARKQELETELRLKTQHFDELNAKLSDVESEREQIDAGGGERLADMHKQLEKRSIELEKLKQKLIDTERLLETKDDDQEETRKQLEAKDAELKALDARFKQYMERSRTIVTHFDKSTTAQSGSGEMSRVEFDSLRRELAHKEKQYDQLVEEVERHKIMHEQEQRLLITGVHGMGLHLHRMASKERLAQAQQANGPASSSTSGLTFVDRQRLLTSNKPRTAQIGGSQQQPNAASSYTHRPSTTLVLPCVCCVLVLCYLCCIVSAHSWPLPCPSLGAWSILREYTHLDGMPPV